MAACPHTSAARLSPGFLRYAAAERSLDASRARAVIGNSRRSPVRLRPAAPRGDRTVRSATDTGILLAGQATMRRYTVPRRASSCQGPCHLGFLRLRPRGRRPARHRGCLPRPDGGASTRRPAGARAVAAASSSSSCSSSEQSSSGRPSAARSRSSGSRPCPVDLDRARRDPGGGPARRRIVRIPVLYPDDSATPPVVVWARRSRLKIGRTRPGPSTRCGGPGRAVGTGYSGWVAAFRTLYMRRP